VSDGSQDNGGGVEGGGGDDAPQTFPITVVMEYEETYGSTFKPFDSLVEVCEQALRNKWKEGRVHLSEWNLTDSRGRRLPEFSKLRDSGLLPRDTVYLSKKTKRP
jgi:hypothetical protein